MNPYLAILCGLLVSTAFRVPQRSADHAGEAAAFIVTLGTLNIAFAITRSTPKSQTISALPRGPRVLRADVRVGQTA